MNNRFEKGSVAVVSPCRMFQAGIGALLSTTSTSLAWQNQINNAQQCLDLQPVELLIVSLHVWQNDLLHALRIIQKVTIFWPKMHLMVILDVTMPYLITQLQKFGVGNILLLTQPLAMVEARICQITNGDSSPIYYCPSTSRCETLSIAERRVVSLLAQGLSIREIGGMMQVSNKTISSHKGNAMHKLGIRHSAQLVVVQKILVDY